MRSENFKKKKSLSRIVDVILSLYDEEEESLKLSHQNSFNIINSGNLPNNWILYLSLIPTYLDKGKEERTSYKFIVSTSFYSYIKKSKKYKWVFIDERDNILKESEINLINLMYNNSHVYIVPESLKVTGINSIINYFNESNTHK